MTSREMSARQPSPRTVLVTGATGGIGRAIVGRLVSAGARVVAADLDRASVQTFASELDRSGHLIAGVELDVRDPESRQRAVDACVERFGSLDTLVNCAGVLKDARLAALDAPTLDLVLDVNLVGPLDLVRRALPLLAHSGRGSVVNVASRAWLGTFGSTAYSAAKGGLVGATRSLALELGPLGVTVNAVAPGFIETAMTAQLPASVRERSVAAIAVGRPGNPDDVAGAVVHLATDASYTTGQVLLICGGRGIGSPMAAAG